MSDGRGTGNRLVPLKVRNARPCQTSSDKRRQSRTRRTLDVVGTGSARPKYSRCSALEPMSRFSESSRVRCGVGQCGTERRRSATIAATFLVQIGLGPDPKETFSQIRVAVRSLGRRVSRGLRSSRAWREYGRHRRHISKVLTYRRPFRVDDPPIRMAFVIWCLLDCLASLPGHRRRSSSRIVEPCGHRPTGKEGITWTR